EHGELTVWNIHTAKIINRLAFPDSLVLDVAYAPDGSTLVILTSDSWSPTSEIHLLDARTLMTIRKWTGGKSDLQSSPLCPKKLSFSPAGTRVIAAGDGTLSAPGFITICDLTM